MSLNNNEQINNDLIIARRLNKDLNAYHYDTDRDGDASWYGYKGYGLEIRCFGSVASRNESISISYEGRIVLQEHYDTATDLLSIPTYIPGRWERLLEGLYENLNVVISEKNEKDRIEALKYSLSKQLCHVCSYGMNVNKLNEILKPYGVSIKYKTEEVDIGCEFSSSRDKFKVYQNGVPMFICNNDIDYSNLYHEAKNVTCFYEGTWIDTLRYAFCKLEEDKKQEHERNERLKDKKVDDIILSLRLKNM